MNKMTYAMKTCTELESDFLSTFQKLRRLVGKYDVQNLAWIMKEHRDIIEYRRRGMTVPFMTNYNYILAESMHHSVFLDDEHIGKDMEALYEKLGVIHAAMEYACVAANAAKIVAAQAVAAKAREAITAKRVATLAARKAAAQAALTAAAAQIAADEAAGIGRRLRTRVVSN